ncbi:MAG: hypothetical protein J6Q54_03745 [Oscillospiraceae bacterium]|nr:hypothetical protein [Oscillospiraceae bacterium]
MEKKALTLREIALFGMLGALTFGAKVAMALLPNIEPVSLFVMLFAVTFGWKALYPTYVYVALEILVYGINLWNINYLYIWALLVVVSILAKRLRDPIWWALIAGLFGLSFGLLCAPVYLFIGGWEYAAAWWISGLPFDYAHAAGNFVIVLLLFMPLRALLIKLIRRFY